MYIIIFNTNDLIRDNEFYDYLKEKINKYGVGVARAGDNSYFVPNSKDITIDYLNEITNNFISEYDADEYREYAFIAEITKNVMCVRGVQQFKQWLEKNN